MLMSPSFLVKILCYKWRSFAISLPLSAIIFAGRYLILKSGDHDFGNDNTADLLISDNSAVDRGLDIFIVQFST